MPVAWWAHTLICNFVDMLHPYVVLLTEVVGLLILNLELLDEQSYTTLQIFCFFFRYDCFWNYSFVCSTVYSCYVPLHVFDMVARMDFCYYVPRISKVWSRWQCQLSFDAFLRITRREFVTYCRKVYYNATYCRKVGWSQMIAISP